MERDSVLVIGSGLMGSGIASRSALAGHRTILLDTALDTAERGRAQALLCIDELEENNLVDPAAATRARTLITVSDDLKSACVEARYVVEAIAEILPAKQDLFAQLDTLLPPEVIILSNTSGLRITDIAAKMTLHPERALTAHFWFPGHLVPLVEIVIGERSNPAYAEEAKALLRTWDKAPVIVKRDLPGQLANRILQAVIREAVNIVELGLCEPEDVDLAIKMGMGIRFPVWGPLEHVDAVGVDLCRNVQATVLPDIADSTAPAKAFEDKIAAGDLGAKSGRGFYDWSQKDMATLAARRNRFIIEALQFHKRNGGIDS